MKSKYFFIIFILGLFLIPFVTAACTGTATQSQVSPGATITVEWSCDSGADKNDPYTVTWFNITGSVEEIIGANDTGTVPNTINEVFIETYTILSSFNVNNNITANLSFGVTQKAGVEIEIVAAGGTDLLITDVKTRGTFLGLSSSIDVDVTDSNSKKITGGVCNVRVQDPTNDENFMIMQHPMSDGDFDATWLLDYTEFKENKDYEVQLTCFCGSNNSIYECINEDGTHIENAVGSTFAPFTTSSWITFNQDPFPLLTASGGSFNSSNTTLFAGFDFINWRRNVTNNNPDNEPISTNVRTFLVNNDTGKIFGLENEGSDSVGERTINAGNSSSTFNHLTSQTTDTGQYFIRLIFDAIYRNQFQVAQYIKETDVFNVTSVQDTFKINSISLQDFFGAEVKLNASLLSNSTMPSQDNTTTHTILTEAFDFDFCINANNTRGDETEVFLYELILENPTLQTSDIIISNEVFGNEHFMDFEASTNNEETCISLKMPIKITTHSDYRLAYDIHIGTESEEFACGSKCEFEGFTDYFFLAKLEDMIKLDKFNVAPNSTTLGNPGIYIVTERNEYLSMLDDVNYTNQEDIDWGNATAICNNKDGGGTQLCDYSKYPRVGERIKTCFEARNYFSDEIFVEMFDIYLDNDKGDTTHFLIREDDFIEFGVKSIQDNDLYISNAPSRALEADENLLDGYATFCTDWIYLPNDLVGGNNWDIQGHVTLDPFVYSLEGEKVYTWESDEFPIFGDFASMPTWMFSPLLKDHYNIPEQWVKASDNQFTFSFNISSLSSTAGLFDFGEHLPFRLLDEATPLERIVNMSLTYQNGSATSLSTELIVTNGGEIVFFINNVDLSKGDNNFTLTANTYDFSKREVVALENSATYENRSATALEGIENKTGTFHLDVNCPSSGTIGSEIACVITAYVEDSQTVQKEVDFTCYISDGTNSYSSTNFNQMITRNALSMSRTFAIPSTFSDGT